MSSKDILQDGPFEITSFHERSEAKIFRIRRIITNGTSKAAVTPMITRPDGLSMTMSQKTNNDRFNTIRPSFPVFRTFSNRAL
jgi:hypothetical protein